VYEHYNGHVRRWLPERTNLSFCTQDHLDTIARQIDHMPRRSLKSAHAHRRYDHALVVVTG